MTPTAKKPEDKKPAAKKPAAKKAAPKKVEAKEEAATTAETGESKAPERKSGSYIYALGRRKSAVAQARLFSGGKGNIQVNGKDCNKYFTVYELNEAVCSPLKAVGLANDMDVHLKVSGGGMRGQAEAARLGVSRALVELNPNYRKTLKALGFMKRDPREKERKKPGLKKARKAPQWAKR